MAKREKKNIKKNKTKKTLKAKGKVKLKKAGIQASPEEHKLLLEAYMKELCNLAESFPKLGYIKDKLSSSSKIKDISEFTKYFRMAVNFLKDELLVKGKEIAQLKTAEKKPVKPPLKEDILRQKDEQILKLNDLVKKFQEDYQKLKVRTEGVLQEKESRAGEGLIIKLLSVVDNFQRAVESISAVSNDDAIYKGVLMIFQQFDDLLQKEGLEKIQSCGNVFDPKCHEAAEEVHTKDFSDQTVIEELRRGYKYKGKIIRPALVKVAKNV